jgi:hypothetical protein
MADPKPEPTVVPISTAVMQPDARPPIRGRTVALDTDLLDNVTDGTLRLLIGVISAGVLLLLLACGILPSLKDRGWQFQRRRSDVADGAGHWFRWGFHGAARPRSPGEAEFTGEWRQQRRYRWLAAVEVSP